MLLSAHGRGEQLYGDRNEYARADAHEQRRKVEHRASVLQLGERRALGLLYVQLSLLDPRRSHGAHLGDDLLRLRARPRDDLRLAVAQRLREARLHRRCHHGKPEDQPDKLVLADLHVVGALEQLARNVEGDGDAQIGADGGEQAERRATRAAGHLRAALGGGRAAHRQP